jgi:hypothetical protein
MFGKWFSRKTRDARSEDDSPRSWGFRIPEPRVSRPTRTRGNPPAGSDRDFVYHER